jgi:hypothetical protein
VAYFEVDLLSPERLRNTTKRIIQRDPSLDRDLNPAPNGNHSTVKFGLCDATKNCNPPRSVRLSLIYFYNLKVKLYPCRRPRMPIGL